MSGVEVSWLLFAAFCAVLQEGNKPRVERDSSESSNLTLLREVSDILAKLDRCPKHQGPRNLEFCRSGEAKFSLKFFLSCVRRRSRKTGSIAEDGSQLGPVLPSLGRVGHS